MPEFPTPRPWPENALPTADELAKRLAICTPAERLQYVTMAQADTGAAARCFMENHDRLRGQVVEGYALAARWEADAARACRGADRHSGCPDCIGTAYAAELRAALDKGAARV